jgi:hypothetical protein
LYLLAAAAVLAILGGLLLSMLPQKRVVNAGEVQDLHNKAPHAAAVPAQDKDKEVVAGLGRGRRGVQLRRVWRGAGLGRGAARCCARPRRVRCGAELRRGLGFQLYFYILVISSNGSDSTRVHPTTEIHQAP